MEEALKVLETIPGIVVTTLYDGDTIKEISVTPLHK